MVEDPTLCKDEPVKKHLYRLYNRISRNLT
nr:MAG TPA: non-SMC mitotic condensation complex subunit 1, N-term [Caudoviricetes sp.]